jgi:hypothetical protein
MDGDHKGTWTVIAIILAWIGYRAGARTQRVSTTWSDHRDLRTKTSIVGKLRWTHLGGAVIAWGVFIIATIVVLKS